MIAVRQAGRQDPDGPRGRKQRSREGKLEAQIVEHLLRASVRLDRPETPREIAAALNAPYPTVTATLRRMAQRGKVHHTYIVNNFKTRFHHEYRVALKLDGRQIAKGDELRRKKLANQTDSHGISNGGPIERFIEELRMGLAANPEHHKHLVISDVVVLHGSPDRDIEISVMTDDGSYTLGRWVRDKLAGNVCISSIHTITVGFRYGLYGYSGHHVVKEGEDSDAIVT